MLGLTDFVLFLSFSFLFGWGVLVFGTMAFTDFSLLRVLVSEEGRGGFPGPAAKSSWYSNVLIV